jgi:hypothetical protein
MPNGIVYRQPETGFKPPAWSSFEVQVQAVMGYRRANKFLAQKYNWGLDYHAVCRDVDAYLAKICKDHGWEKMYFDAEPPLFDESKKKALAKVAAVAGGGRTLVEWVADGAPTVPNELAEARAAVCAECPKNGEGGFESYFTRPVSEAIRKELVKRHTRNLSTSLDDKVNVCEVCLCPIKLKLHMPIENISKRMDAQTKKELPEHCWIIKEQNG